MCTGVRCKEVLVMVCCEMWDGVLVGCERCAVVTFIICCARASLAVSSHTLP